MNSGLNINTQVDVNIPSATLAKLAVTAIGVTLLILILIKLFR